MPGGPTDIHLTLHKGDLSFEIHASSLEEALELIRTAPRPTGWFPAQSHAPGDMPVG